MNNMHFNVISLFPDLIEGYFEYSILKRAKEANIDVDKLEYEEDGVTPKVTDEMLELFAIYSNGIFDKEFFQIYIDQAKSIGYRMLGLEEDFSKFDLTGPSLSRPRHTFQVVSEILDIDNKIIKKEDLLISKCWTNFPKPTEEEKKEKEANPWIWAPKGCIESI